MALGKKTGGRDFKKGKSGGPGRPKLTPDQRMQKKALFDFYKEYLESGEAIKDFKKAKSKLPLACIQEAADRLHGKARQSIEMSREINLTQIIINHSDDKKVTTVEISGNDNGSRTVFLGDNAEETL